MSAKEVVVAGAVRTPIGRFGGGLLKLSAADLGTAAAEEALHTLCIAPETTLVLDHGGGFGRDLVTVVRRADVERRRLRLRR